MLTHIARKWGTHRDLVCACLSFLVFPLLPSISPPLPSFPPPVSPPLSSPHASHVWDSYNKKLGKSVWKLSEIESE